MGLNKIYRFPVFLFTLILLIYGLIEARSFLFPLSLSVLLAYLLYPLGQWLEKHKVPRILANLICILLAIAVLMGVFMFIYSQIQYMVNDFSNIKAHIVRNTNALQDGMAQLFDFANIKPNEVFNARVSSFFQSGIRALDDVFGATTGTIVAIGLMPVYIFLFLYYRTKFARFIIRMVPEEKKFMVVRLLKNIAHVIPKYMGGVLVVVFILFFLNSFGLYIIGIEYPVTLGVLAALFNIIPYFGTLLGGLIPLTFAILTGSLPHDPLNVILLFGIIQFTENNILTPNIVGGNVKISPFFIIIGLVASSMIWGVPGMLVIVPFLAILRIIFSHIPSMKPWAFLLGTSGTKNYTLTLSPVKRFLRLKK